MPKQVIMKAFLRSIATTLLFSLLFSGGLWTQTPIQPTQGNGSSDNPYQIATLENLLWVRQQTNDLGENNWSVGKYFEQTADIDLISIDNWEPIGLDASGKRFEGNYDGNGYAIRNLNINRPNDDYQGLFGRCDNSTLKNIRLENVVIRGRERVGGLAGRTAGSVQNSSVTGTVRGSREYVGGMVGQGSDASLSNRLVFIGKVEGGIIADNSGNDVGIGGIVGRASGSTSVSTAYVRGEVNGNRAGGLVGSSSGGASTFSDAYTAVEIGTS